MPEIRIEDLHYRYPPFDPRDPIEPPLALDGINVAIPTGEFLGITGTMGSGKSSLCLALIGLVPQQTSGTIRGDVWIGDWNTKRTPVPQMATRVGIVFQDPEANFVGLSVEDEVAFGLENLGVPAGQIGERVRAALEIVGISDLVDRRVSSLSGGQKQRVAIAAALTMEPKVLVLDDPTAELDPAGRASVIELIANVSQQHGEMTIVMAGNDAETMARHADRIVVLDAGQIVASGSPDEIYGNLTALPAAVPRPELADIAAGLQRAVGFSLPTVDYTDARDTIAAHLQPSPDV